MNDIIFDYVRNDLSMDGEVSSIVWTVSLNITARGTPVSLHKWLEIGGGGGGSRHQKENEGRKIQEGGGGGEFINNVTLIYV